LTRGGGRIAGQTRGKGELAAKRAKNTRKNQTRTDQLGCDRGKSSWVDRPNQFLSIQRGRRDQKKTEDKRK